MTERSNDWDPESNIPETTIISGTLNTSNTTISGTGVENAVLSIDGSGSYATWLSNITSFASIQTNINPGQLVYVNSSQYISPISFSFQNSNWKYILCYILNLLCAPWLCIWSKITGRPAGFRIKNPDWNRARNPITGDPILR